MADRFDLSESVAIVAGGAGLLGASVTRGLHQHGCTVVIADKDSERGQNLAIQLGERARFEEIDLTKTDEMDALVSEVVDSYGAIDVLVNVSYPRSESYGQRFESVGADEWETNVSRHLKGYFVPIVSVSRRMVNQGFGSIVNFASIYGVQAPDFTVYDGTEMTSPVEYAAIKGGIVNLTRYLASYLGPDGVRVNAVSPGGVFDEQDATFVEQYEKQTPLGRMADPDDVMGAVIFLASEASAYVTGHNLVVDGGWTIT